MIDVMPSCSDCHPSFSNFCAYAPWIYSVLAWNTISMLTFILAWIIFAFNSHYNEYTSHRCNVFVICMSLSIPDSFIHSGQFCCSRLLALLGPRDATLGRLPSAFFSTSLIWFLITCVSLLLHFSLVLGLFQYLRPPFYFLLVRKGPLICALSSSMTASRFNFNKPCQN